MKKIFFFCIILFISCQNDSELKKKSESEKIIPEPILAPLNKNKVVSKILYKVNGEETTINYEYKNNQITKVNHSKLGVYDLIYNGNKLMEINSQDSVWKIKMEYLGDKLIKSNLDNQITTEYFYDSEDKLIETNTYEGVPLKYQYKTTFSYKKNNMTNAIKIINNQNSISSTYYNYLYYDRYNPYINHNKYFNIVSDLDKFIPIKYSYNVTDLEFNLYYSRMVTSSSLFAVIVDYDSDDFFTKYILKRKSNGEIWEELNYEYINLTDVN